MGQSGAQCGGFFAAVPPPSDQVPCITRMQPRILRLSMTFWGIVPRVRIHVAGGGGEYRVQPSDFVLIAMKEKCTRSPNTISHAVNTLTPVVVPANAPLGICNQMEM
mmetsp:Transcript_15407/g.24636  ORF Transcript_15407/g.24636 Transcript_15407/m.24636 type:complete len:107 (+) Transcript_15407:507-827(+)